MAIKLYLCFGLKSYVGEYVDNEVIVKPVPTDDPFFGESVLIVPQEGDPEEEHIFYSELVGNVPMGLGAPFPLDLSTKNRKQLVHFNPGFNDVDGPKSTAKTELIIYTRSKAIEAGFKTTYLRFSEPEIVYLLDDDSLSAVPAITSEFVFISKLMKALLDPTIDIIFIDSFKKYIYMAKQGNTGKGGISMGLFDYLTAFSSIALRLNKIVVGVTNPLMSEDALIDDSTFASNYQSGLDSSIQTTIFLLTRHKMRYTTRDPRGTRTDLTFHDFNPIFTPSINRRKQKITDLLAR